MKKLIFLLFLQGCAYQLVVPHDNRSPYGVDPELQSYIDQFEEDWGHPPHVGVRFYSLSWPTVARYDQGWILIDPDSWYGHGPWTRWGIMYHELGHGVFNFGHSPEGIMKEELLGEDFYRENWEELRREFFDGAHKKFHGDLR